MTSNINIVITLLMTLIVNKSQFNCPKRNKCRAGFQISTIANIALMLHTKTQSERLGFKIAVTNDALKDRLIKINPIFIITSDVKTSVRLSAWASFMRVAINKMIANVLKITKP